MKKQHGKCSVFANLFYEIDWILVSDFVSKRRSVLFFNFYLCVLKKWNKVNYVEIMVVDKIFARGRISIFIFYEIRKNT